jgi:hypothetical protein
MYPISAEKRLSLLDVADHWAGELGQPSRYHQVLQNLIRAWWGGEFGPIEAERRVPALKWLYKHRRKEISFLIPGQDVPDEVRELRHGRVKVDISYRVPVPNTDPSSWTQANCADAFKILADEWSLHLIPEASDNLAFRKVSEADFSSWVSAQGYSRPKFWAHGKNRGDSVLTAVSSAQTDRVHKERGRPPVVFNRVVKEMRAAISENRTTHKGLWEEMEKTLASCELSGGCPSGSDRER